MQASKEDASMDRDKVHNGFRAWVNITWEREVKRSCVAYRLK